MILNKDELSLIYSALVDRHSATVKTLLQKREKLGKFNEYIESEIKQEIILLEEEAEKAHDLARKIEVEIKAQQ